MIFSDGFVIFCHFKILLFFLYIFILCTDDFPPYLISLNDYKLFEAKPLLDSLICVRVVKSHL